MKAVVDVVTEEIHCTSTGGRVLDMSITGPHGVVSALSNIQAVGTQRWMGNDSYSASGTVAGANDEDTYNCTASNGVSSATDSVEIRGETIIFAIHRQRSWWVEKAIPLSPNIVVFVLCAMHHVVNVYFICLSNLPTPRDRIA